MLRTTGANLTPREHQVIRHTLEGLTSKQTARLMNISYRTVEKHLDNIKRKIDCRRKSELLYKLFYRFKDIQV